MNAYDQLDRLRDWMGERGWTPFVFQEDTWAAYLNGESGLVHVPTGAGKTYASYFGPLADVAARGESGLQIIYLTPLRAMARDIAGALAAPVDELGLEVEVASRTGDTSSYQRRKQKTHPPHVLITTPESLSLLLSYANAASYFSKVRAVVVDEWHELLSSKRGTLCELSLSRVRGLSDDVRIWALSATLANLEDAARCATGTEVDPVIVTAELERPVEIRSLVPDPVEAFPWYGHMGLTMRDQVVEDLDIERSTLVFTNTRNQAERWYQAILDARPEWESRVGLHHGSIDREDRHAVEEGLKDGTLKIAVATSSLDLGVDFAPVERIYQMGSPKGIARLLQRAGRSGHRPGESCRITFVPSHALQLIEIAALRDAMGRGEIEPRLALSKPLDVLAQHLVTCALGGGFAEAEILAEVRTAASYADLSNQEFQWVMELVTQGGKTLKAYPRYHKVVEEDGVHRVPDRRIARQHRSNIGTITSASSIRLRFLNGRSLGTVEERYIGRLKEGETFVFAGRTLEFVKIHQMEAWVRLSKTRAESTPRWVGGRLSLSTELAESMRKVFTKARQEVYEWPETRDARPIFEHQRSISLIPRDDATLVEFFQSSEGFHLFLYPFEGRLVHEGLAPLLAYRMTRSVDGTFAMSVNDYGIEFATSVEYPFHELITPEIFTTDNLLEDTLESINISELARRQFRDIARVAGLVFEGYPGRRKNNRQLQSSAGLIYDVFLKYDPDNLLLMQAQREVLERHFEQSRLRACLERLSAAELEWVDIERPSPLSFPLLVDRVRNARVSSESLVQRIERMKGG